MASFRTNYPTPLERQFTRFYNHECHQYAHLHKNKSVTMIGLSPDHPAVSAGIVRVEFSKSASANEALGKRKRGALGLRTDTIVCHIETKTGETLRIDAQVNIDLVEINSRLETQPELVSMDPEGAGFLCVGLTRTETDMDKCFPGFVLGGNVSTFKKLYVDSVV
jgi:hypothetical protein